jgi:hypothetical protein
MLYVRKNEVPGWLSAAMDEVSSIDRTGSVRGMRNRFGWSKGGQVRIGGYIYNIGPNRVKKLRDMGILRA